MNKNKFYKTKKIIEEGNIFNKKFNNLKNNHEKIAWIMMKHPNTRNDDIKLLYYYYKHSGIITTLPNYKTTKKIGTPGSLVRRRTEIQKEMKLLIPTEKETINERRITKNIINEWKKNKLNKY